MPGTPAAAFPKASFDGISFLYTDITVKGGARIARHEFPHQAGEEIEKQGRKAYVINFKALFHDVPGSLMATNYPNAYPLALRNLQEKFDLQVTKDLVIPTIGTIKATATEWTRTFRTTVTSGESVDLEFIEDQDVPILVGTLDSAQAVIVTNETVQALAAIADFKRGTTLSIFQQIDDAVTEVQGVFGRADAYNRLVASKIEAVANLCAVADQQLDEMQDPMNHVLISAMKDLYLAARSVADNITQSRAQLKNYNVPKLMSVQQVALALYGATDRTTEVLQLNAFEDAFAIPAGTTVKYIAA